jgi:hypothetical protein
MMELLFEQRGEEIQLTEEVVLEVVKRHADDCVGLLLLCFGRQAEQLEITENFVKAVAGNWHGAELMNILLDQRGKRVHITGDVLIIAAGTGNGEKIMEVLLNRRGEDVRIIEELENTIARNRY